MTPEETAKLLAYASAVDPRIRRKDPDELRLQIVAWHKQLGSVPLEPARAAVDAHYAAGGVDAILPGDVRSAASGSAAERHPSARSVAEALAEIEAQVVGDRTPVELPPGMDEPAAREAARARVEQALRQVAAQRALPDESSPTGYVPRRVRRVGLAAACGPRRNLGPTHDAAGRPLTVCHRCVADIPAPEGWDPASEDSPKLYCGRCQPDSVAGQKTS
jgi:hypothetical protein